MTGRRQVRIVAVVLALMLVCSAATAAEVAFTARPTVTQHGAGATIRFAVSKPTDVEVAILDAKGKVVRHLAAGLLGANAPAPLKKDALGQELVWDGKDDLGKPAVGGPFSVRVRIGSTPRLDRILGWDSNTLSGSVIGLTVGEKGELYVLIKSGWGQSEMRVFDRTGRYVRTIMPYSAGLPADRVKSIGQLEVAGERLPIIYNAHGGNLHPLTSGLRQQQMAWHPKGYLLLMSAVGTLVEHGPPRHLLALGADGGVPEGMRFVGSRIEAPRGFLGGAGDVDRHFDHLAVSPDGEWIYYSPSVWRHHHAVFRLKWNQAGKVGMEEGFLGIDWVPGHDDYHLNDPQGLAVDPEGNIYVCDRGNDRVMIFKADGTLLGKFPVENPQQIAVHPKTRAIYVACRERRGRPTDVSPMSMAEYRAWRARERERAARRPKPKPPAVIKFSPFGDKPSREVARLDTGVGLMTLDPASDPPRLWVTARGGIVPVVDRGAELEAGQSITTHAGLRSPAFLVPDPARNRLLVRDLFTGMRNNPIKSVDLSSGEKTGFLSAAEVAVAADGTIYGTGPYSSNALYRYDAAGKPLPFPDTGSNKIETGRWWSYGPNIGLRGLCVAPNGDVYFLRSQKGGTGERGVGARIDVFGPDGKKKKPALIDGVGYGDCGLGVDARGNIYLGANVKPADRPFPNGFTGAVPERAWVWWRDGRARPWSYPYYNAYLYHWGGVFKFRPEGGAFYGRVLPWYRRRKSKDEEPSPLTVAANAPAGAATYRSGYLERDVKVAGAAWFRAGFGPVPASDVSWGDPSCCCITSRLGVDRYGRVFAPNVFRFSVEMLDTNGNHVHRIGRYGNNDDRDSGIRFAWPAFVAARDGAIYVSDVTNRRVVAMRLDWQAEAVRAISTGS